MGNSLNMRGAVSGFSNLAVVEPAAQSAAQGE